MINIKSIKSILIPEGNVKKITLNGFILWDKIIEDIVYTLPEEYQEVEYIRSTISSTTSSSYIDLGFAFDESASFTIHYIPAVQSSAAYIFGAAENSGKLRCMITDQVSDTLLYGSNGTGYIIANGVAKHNNEKKLECVLKPGNLYIKDLLTGNVSGVNTSQASYTMTSNLYLFGQNYNGAARFGDGNSQLKFFSYRDKTGKILSYLIPCYRKVDNVVGMYDAARGIFLTNAGTGSFVAGPDIPSSSPSYETVSILENTTINELENTLISEIER